MALNKYRLGNLIEEYKEKCNIPDLTVDDVSGINRDKEFFEPSKQVGKDTSNYKVVPPNYFACNLMHVGRDVVLPVAINHTSKNKIVSPAYSVFKIKDEKLVLKEFFFMILNSVQKDRFFWFNTDSSVRDGLAWEDFCKIELEFPSIEIQQKYVDIYKAMVENQKVYESRLEDLKLVCDGYIEDLRKKMPCEKIGKYIELKRIKNSDNKIKTVYGVSTQQKFIEPSSSVNKNELSGYKIVEFEDIAYVPTTHMKVWAIGLSNKIDPFVVSPIYEVFGVKDKSKLCPEYLFLWLCRNETIRYAFYNSWGSARENFVYDDMCTIAIPIPDITVQKSIAEIFKVLEERKEINEKLKTQIKDICPVLIQGALKEGRK